MVKKAHLDFWIENNYNVLFIGKHGVGKTSMIKSAFEEHGLNWKYYSASTMDPWVDLVGVPREQTDLVSGEKYLDLVRPRDLQQDKVEALFFDEFNRSHKKVRNAVMELIQFKSINGKKFNNLKLVWAAINPEDDEDEEYDVERLDPAQADRFHVYVEIPYEPSYSYFKDKYSEEYSSAACEWWENLPKEIKNMVSPRRLDYALEAHSLGGDLNFILPKDSNPHALVSRLQFGSIEKKLEDLYNSGTDKEIREFVNNENNYRLCEDKILEKETYTDKFVPFFPEDKIAKSVSHSFNSRRFQQIINLSLKHETVKSAIQSIVNTQGSPYKKSIDNVILQSTRLKKLFYPQHFCHLYDKFYTDREKTPQIEERFYLLTEAIALSMQEKMCAAEFVNISATLLSTFSEEEIQDHWDSFMGYGIERFHSHFYKCANSIIDDTNLSRDFLNAISIRLGLDPHATIQAANKNPFVLESPDLKFDESGNAKLIDVHGDLLEQKQRKFTEDIKKALSKDEIEDVKKYAEILKNSTKADYQQQTIVEKSSDD